MRWIMPVDAWQVLSVLLVPIGYVIQDVVADPMTVEVVLHPKNKGRAFDEGSKRLMKTTPTNQVRVRNISSRHLEG